MHLSFNNFRSFKQKVDFDFTNVNLLVGPNSSGKSSVFKLLLLLRENFLPGFYRDIFSQPELRFNKKSRALYDFRNILPDLDEKKQLYVILPGSENQEIHLVFEVCHSSSTSPGVGFLKTLSIFNKSDHDNAGLEQKEHKYLLKLDFSFDLDWLEAEIDLVEIKAIIDRRGEFYSGYNKALSFASSASLPKSKKASSSKKDREKREQKSYNPDTPIFNTTELSKKLSLSPEEIEQSIFENLRLKRLESDPDGSDCNIASYFQQIHRFSNPRTNTRKKINYEGELTTLNGILFFDEVERYLKDGLRGMVENLQNIVFINNERNLTNRVFLLYEDSTLNKLINRYIQDESNFNKQFIERWLLRFEVINKDEKLEIINLANSACEIVFTTKGQQRKRKSRNLLDEGYGIIQLFSIIISLSELEHYKINCIEEPEVNLHPKFQSLLAEMFVEASKIFGKKLLIETHSEYILRKAQYLVAANQLPTDAIKIFYFHKDKGETKIREIFIRRDGRLTADFGTGFIDESTKIIFDIWNLPGQN
jgi:predicted ATPase